MPTPRQARMMCQPREKPIWDLGAIRLPAATIVPCEIMPAQTPGLTHEKCPRNALGASHKNARETVTVVRHGKWVVDDVSCGDDHQGPQGVCEGLQEGQGTDSGSGGRGDGVVARQCPAKAYCSGDAAIGAGSQHCEAGAQASGSEVFLRRAQGAAAGLGRLRWAVREVSGCFDAAAARRARTPRRAGLWS